MDKNKSAIEDDSNLLEIIRKRRSVRKFSSKPVEDEKIIQMVEAARLAPSASNGQPWRFFAIKSRAKLEAVAEAAGTINNWLKTAPLIMVACSSGGNISGFIGRNIKGIDFNLLDLGIAVEHMALSAAEMGISTCWIGWFDAKKIKKVLEIPSNLRIVCLLAVGYAREDVKQSKKKRLSLDEILFFK